MNAILVPTDFSACAAFATQTAMDIASRNKAAIHLFTTIDIQEDWSKLSEEEKNKNPEAIQKIRNAEVLLKEWENKATAKNINIQTAWSEGNLIENIQAYVEEYKIDFIVMGSHGASGKNEFFIGSNTQKVVRTVHCPILIVKEELNTFNPKKVVFASEFEEAEKEAFQYLLDLVRPFNPEIHLLEVNTSSWFGQPFVLAKASMEDFKVMCGELKCFLHFYRDWSIEAGIRNLSEEIGADLIAIANLQRRPVKRMFSGSNVEALVNHANAPVLSIDFPKVNTH